MKTSDHRPLVYAEADWEPSVDLPVVDDVWLHDRLAAWPGLLKNGWTRLGGGLRSLNIRLGDVVARIALDADVLGDGVKTLAKEAEVMRLLADRLPVPEVIACQDGVLLTRWVDHGPLTDAPQEGLAVGRAAAQIHSVRYESGGMLGPDLTVSEPFSDTWDWLRGWAEGLMGKSPQVWKTGKGDQLRELWDQHDTQLREACVRPSLLHCDFKPANIKATMSAKKIVVFDWEFCAAGPALLDLGQLLRWGVPKPFLLAVEQGYIEAGGVLPEDWQRTAELFDAVNLVAFLNRVPEGSACWQDVERRIKQTLK